MANAEILVPIALPDIIIGGLGASSGYSAQYAANDYRGVVYRSGGSVDSGYLQFDFGMDVNIDRLMMFGVSGAPKDARVRIQASTQSAGSTYGDIVSDDVLLFAGEKRLASGGVSYVDLSGISSPARYWRIYFTNLNGAAINIGRIVFGKAIRLDRNFVFGGTFGVRDFSSVDFGERGNFLFTKRQKMRVTGIIFNHVYRDEIEQKIQPLLEEVGNSQAIALIIDPEAHPLREQRCYFGPILGDLNTIWRSAKSNEWRAEIISLF